MIIVLDNATPVITCTVRIFAATSACQPDNGSPVIDIAWRILEVVLIWFDVIVLFYIEVFFYIKVHEPKKALIKDIGSVNRVHLITVYPTIPDISWLSCSHFVHWVKCKIFIKIKSLFSHSNLKDIVRFDSCRLVDTLPWSWTQIKLTPEFRKISSVNLGSEVTSLDSFSSSSPPSSTYWPWPRWCGFSGVDQNPSLASVGCACDPASMLFRFGSLPGIALLSRVWITTSVRFPESFHTGSFLFLVSLMSSSLTTPPWLTRLCGAQKPTKLQLFTF